VCERAGHLIGAGRDKGKERAGGGQKGKGHKGKGPQRDGHYANPAYQSVWAGYDWARGLAKQVMYTDKAGSAEMIAVLNAHRAEVDGCVFRALLAYHRAGDDLRFFDREWKPLTEPQLHGVLAEYARLLKRRVSLWRLTAAGELDHEVVFNRDQARRVTVALVPAGLGQGHLLPIIPDDQASVVLPDLVLDDLIGPGRRDRGGLRVPPPQPERVPAVQPRGHGRGRPQDPVEGQEEDEPQYGPQEAAQEQAAVHVPEALPQGVVDADPQPVQPAVVDAPQPPPAALNAGVEDAEGGYGQPAAGGDHAPVPNAPAPAEPQQPEGVDLEAPEQQRQRRVLAQRAYLRGGEPPRGPPVHGPQSRRPCYYGAQPPPPGLGAEWVGGWWESQVSLGTVDDELLGLLSNAAMSGPLSRVMRTPDYASATPECFKLWGVGVRYCPVRLSEGLQSAGRRSYTDGTRSGEFFTAGDALRCGGARWTVRQVDGYLRVTPANVRARCSIRWADVQVAPTALDLAEESARKAAWLIVVAKESDPIMLSVLNRLKADEAAKGYPGDVSPHDAVAVARQMVGRHEYQQVGAPFRWGYCYGCGSPLPGKMVHRLCKGCTRGPNSELGAQVAAGRRVTGLANPIVYPGVVRTQSHHPRLKDGVASVASERCFRWSPRS